MLNFHNLQPITIDTYSFVGIQKDGGEILLYLPHGFDANKFNTYNSKRDIYFLLYKILKRYKQICNENDKLKSQSTQDRDGVVHQDGSVQEVVLSQGYEELLLYSKLDAIGSIIDAYDEPKIMSLAYRLGESEEVDYSQIHRYLDIAKFLPDGAAYIDVMDVPRLQVRYQSTDIVKMYCYIFIEIKQQLDEEIPSEIQALAEEFAHRYLDVEGGLFHEDYSTQTVELLKDTLETIEHRTPIKDIDFWDFHDAIELFLYGELSQQSEGEIWGINNFCYVWESMCLTYLVKTINPENLLWIDRSFLAQETLALLDYEKRFLNIDKAFNINGKELRPDAVVLRTCFEKKNFDKDFDLVLTGFTTHQGIPYDDYGYWTTCRYEYDYITEDEDFYLLTISSSIKIAHEDMATCDYIFDELSQLYPHKNGYIDKLNINTQLPEKYISYADILPERIEQAATMYRLNHIFYCMVKNMCFKVDFFEFYLSEFLEVDCESSNAFNYSVFRRFTQNGDKRYQLLDSFKEYLNNYCYFDIIDFKYKDTSYYEKPETREKQDIRKQFTYEYLLQEFLIFRGRFNRLNVKSSFWLPHNNDDKLEEITTTLNQSLLNGCIDLKQINFMTIAQYYF